jgi:membrane-bound ClpP family serine protease
VLSGPIIWAIGLMAVALLLLVMEMFIPSGGGLSFMAAVAIVAAIAVAFYADGIRGGTTFLGITVMCLPLLFWGFVKWWPDTPIGRILVARPPTENEIIPDDHGLHELIGRFGQTTTPMLPSGVIRISGRSYDALSEGLPIDEGTRIKVLSVSGAQVMVRSVSPQEEALAARGDDDRDVLSRPLEDLGLESLDDPLA